MAKEDLTRLGHGGAGFQGDGPGSAAAGMKELQGLTISLLAGAGANTKINLAAIRQEDTVVAALNNNAGTITDITGTISIENVKATGTITAAAVVAADTVTVGGKVFTAVANDADVEAHDYTKFKIGTTNAECAANIAAAINKQQGNAVATHRADADSAVVTITALDEGVGGNSIGLLSSNGTRLAVTGSGTLAGGTSTGGIESTGATNQVILFWLNKE